VSPLRNKWNRLPGRSSVCVTVPTPSIWLNSWLKRLLSLALVILCVQGAGPGQFMAASRVWDPIREPRTSAVALDPEAEGSYPEYLAKAGCLHHFIVYTTWPKGALGAKDKPLEVWVIGDDRFDGHLEKTFKDKVLQERKVVVRYKPSVPKEVTAHVVFASGLTEKENKALRALCKDKPILLIGDEPEAAEQGSCASFEVVKRKIRFRVNPDAIKAHGLEMSSNLLHLAQIVKTKGAAK
jgi:hypothetical protein